MNGAAEGSPAPGSEGGGPRHPTGRALVLMALVLVALVALAALSATGRI